MAIRRLRLFAVAAALAAAVGVAVHSAGQSAGPGSFVDWPSAATPPASAPLASLLPSTTPPAPADGGLLGGLRVPLSAMLQGLNQETAASAAGQYNILSELSDALRERIDSFLSWVTAHH
ncbi:MAG: hypothetical protein JOY68_10055 [Candidatus Dormibacteraeota bacterium]|nr:hypothetical protein [Candidatus Dormibacteraeota bacterium]